MHICYFTSEYPKPGKTHGGIATFLEGMATSLTRENIRITIVSLAAGINKTEVVQEGLLTIYYHYFSKWPAFKFIDLSLRFNKCINEVHLSSTLGS